MKSVEHEFDLILGILPAVKAFWAGSNSVEREEFRSFVEPLLGQYRAIETIHWVPVVRDEDRRRVELDARDDIPDFAIRERGPDGLRVADRRD